MTEKEMQIVEVYPGCKYIIVAEELLLDDDLLDVQKRVNEWLNGPNEFLIISGFKLVKVKDGQDSSS